MGLDIRAGSKARPCTGEDHEVDARPGRGRGEVTRAQGILVAILGALIGFGSVWGGAYVWSITGVNSWAGLPVMMTAALLAGVCGIGRMTGLSRAEYAARYRERHPDVPVVPNLDAQILAAIEAGGTLDMSDWHTCATTHCRAGWAITLAGEAGRTLESERGPRAAGAAIYRASTGRAPWFFAPTDVALEDIRRCAEVADE